MIHPLNISPTITQPVARHRSMKMYSESHCLSTCNNAGEYKFIWEKKPEKVKSNLNKKHLRSTVKCSYISHLFQTPKSTCDYNFHSISVFPFINQADCGIDLQRQPLFTNNCFKQSSCKVCMNTCKDKSLCTTSHLIYECYRPILLIFCAD